MLVAIERPTGPLTTDAREVEAARAGDRRAFAALFARYAPMVHGILLARVRPGAVADLIQDVFVSALERLDGLRDPQAFGAWLGSIARNRATDHHRTHRPTTELPEDLSTGQTAGARTEAERVLEEIRALPEAYRETLVLRLVEGMSGAEIAARVGLTPESVRVNLHRGMKLLRERLGAESHEETP